MTKEQKEALKLLVGLSQEEIIDGVKELGKSKYVIEEDEDYFNLDEFGYISCGNYTKDDISTFCISTKKSFKTETEAEEYKKVQRAYMRIINWIRKANNGWEPDFSGQVDNHHICIELSPGPNNFGVMCNKIHQTLPIELYLKSFDLCQQLIKELPEDLRLYYNYKNFNWIEVE